MSGARRPAARPTGGAGGNPATRPAPGIAPGLVFHVVNGDSTLALLRKTRLPGEAVAWPDMLMEGPLKADRAGHLDWAARARWLSRAYGVDRKAAAARMAAFRKALALAAGSPGEVVLWFEEDWFCQVHLAYLLATLPAALRKPGRLSVICPAKALGRHSPAALERLFARRRAPAKPLLALATRAWKALAGSFGVTLEIPRGPAAPDAASRRKLAALAAAPAGCAAWPRLRSGILAHLERYPSEDGRPGSLERAVRAALAKAGPGGLAFPDLFRAVASHPRVRPLGLGDAQVARAVLDLAARKDRPLTIKGRGRRPAPSDPLDFRAARIVPTPGPR